MNFIRSFKAKSPTTSLLCMYACAFILCLCVLNFNNTLNAIDVQNRHDRTLELGIRLETEYWNLVKHQENKRAAKKVALTFQGLDIDGVYNRKQQIDGLIGVTLHNFSLRNPVAHRSQNILVFSYDFVAPGSDLTTGPNTTIWKKDNGSWKIVSHSYVPFTD